MPASLSFRHRKSRRKYHKPPFQPFFCNDDVHLLARAVVLRRWLEVPEENAREFLVEHSPLLRDPTTIAMLILWQRQEVDPSRQRRLAIYRSWLIS